MAQPKTTTKDDDLKRWKGLKYLETHVGLVQSSSEAVATGFANTFQPDLLDTVDAQIS